MFDITSCRDFHKKLKADAGDFAQQQDSARLALNCIITAYHLHEWVWGDWLKTEYAIWKKLGVRDENSFVAWIERECPAFRTVQGLTNGAKHFIRNQNVATRHIAGYDMGPCGVGPYGANYLLIDYGPDAGDQRYETATDVVEAVVSFWDAFFALYLPEPKVEGADATSPE